MRTAGKILSVILIVSLCLAPFSVSGKKEVKIAFLDSGVSLKHIDPEKVLEQIPSVISLDQLDIHCKHGTGRAAEVEKWLIRNMTCSTVSSVFLECRGDKTGIRI